MAQVFKNIFDVSDKVVLISGGSRGIGEMIAQAFINNGAKVYISSRKQEDLDETANRLNNEGPGKAIAIAADISTENGCQALAKKFCEMESKLDVLVNNAGATWGHPMESHPDKAFDRCFDLNVKGVFHLTKFLLPQLKKAASQENPASVINISSIAGHNISSSHIISYSASKAAVSHLSRNMAAHLAPDFIRVNVIAPGMFPSKMTAGSLQLSGGEKAYAEANVPFKRIGQPADLGGLAIYLSSKAGSYATGQIIAVDGGASIQLQSKF